MANRYWVGNGGDWNTTAHWSTTSNGLSGASIPTIDDDVIIDKKSIKLNGQTITTLDVEVVAKSLTITPSHNITFSHTNIKITTGYVCAHRTTIVNSVAKGGAVFSAPTGTPYNNVDGGSNSGWNFTDIANIFTISKSSGTVVAENTTFYGCRAIGGALFLAASRSNSDLGFNYGWIFSGFYSISGNVSGSVPEGLPIDLTGDVTNSTLLDEDGNYIFSGLEDGNYTVTPFTMGSPVFVPDHIDIILDAANSVDNNFTAHMTFESSFGDTLTLADSFSKIKTLNLISIGIGLGTTMLVGSSQQASATGYYDDGSSKDITYDVTWSSSDSTVASITATGLISALKTGICFITAMLTTVAYGEIRSRVALNVIQLDSSVFAGDETTLQCVQLNSLPNQTFNVTPTIDGKKLTIKVQLRWNIQAQYWVMTVINIKTGEYYVDDIPLMAGILPTINLLEPHSYLQIGSCYVVNISGSSTDVPNQYNLGTDFILLWGDTEV